MGTTVHLRYGNGYLAMELPTENVDLFEPKPMEALANPRGAFEAALEQPAGGITKLRDHIQSGAKVVIVTPDRTRVFPSDVLHWLLRTVTSKTDKQNVTIVTGTGSHSPDTADDLLNMFGADILQHHKIISHNARDDHALIGVGQTPSGKPLKLNRHYTEADVKIGVGYIEPHFMAGYSGGHKAIVPGVADLDTIMEYHGPQVIDSPDSTWGKLEGNPTQEFLRYCGNQCSMDFLVNFALNERREFVRFDCGEVMTAHSAGCSFVGRHAMVQADRLYKIMVTTNKGAPADLNLYQSVKGMTAAAEVIAPSGLIISAAECRAGFPDHGNFRSKLLSGMTPAELRADLFGEHYADSWEVLKLINIMLQRRARIALLSTLPPDEVRKAGLEPIDDVAARVGQELDVIGRDERVGVIPSGFDAIPLRPTA